MQILKKYKVELCCSHRNDRRGALEAAHLDVEGNCVVATNGRIMAVVPVQELLPVDVSGPVTGDALKEARKLDKKTSEVATIECNGSLKLSNGATFVRPDLGNYPNYKQVQPDAGRPVGFKIALDPELLMRLAEAIGWNEKQKAVILEFGATAKDVIKVTRQGDTAYGVLMPTRIA